MKFALIFLMAFVAMSQQFYFQRPNIPMVWLAPHPARYFMNNYRPLVAFNEDLNRDLADSQSNSNGEQEEYPDVQSRIKGNRPSDFEIQPQSGRFLAGSFGNNDGYSYNANQNSNPFLRTYTTTTTSTSTSYSLSTSTSTSIIVTATTTSTSTATIVSTATLSLTSVVRCVPALQVSAIPVSCGRKKRGIDEDSEEHHQFIISPSETLKLTPTALPSERNERALPNTDDVTSSKDEVANVEVSQEDQSRAKRFFLLNRNLYSTSTVLTTSTSTIVIPTTTVSQSISTVTTFATTTSTSYFFSNSTVTQTVNLLNPAPAVQCAAVAVAAAAPAAAIPQCISCLPVGYIVCPASG
ncbi:cell wall protein DAN4-like [Daphnia pulex]|uniref:cell wall protein DAN4-like n=1 Tax=Daphnia pulex TaxID=6669 RepID=UPI001EE01379|nr:cell wall protein DAN4-like [Daphnia pulex]